MYATVQKWGNSQGIRLPNVLLKSLDIKENDQLEIIQVKDGIQLRKAPKVHRSFEERFAEQFGVPPEESDIRFDNEELDWGGPQGAEVW